MDIDKGKVETLRSGGALPMHEPGLPEVVERNRERLRFTTEIAELLDGCRLLFCCVDTPPTYRRCRPLAGGGGRLADPRGGWHALVMRAPSRPAPAAIPASEARSAPTFPAPRFLKEGSAVNDFLEPDREFVIGAAPAPDRQRTRWPTSMPA